LTYSQLLHANADSYRQAFELLADPENLPLLCHCTAGKDRTGIMAVLLLSLLGVDRPTIVQDYELSIPVAGSTRPAELQALFQELDAAGGIEPFLAGLGVSQQTQAAIRKQMLE
jgi:protein tyrosine/serine phosphatase